MLKIKLLISTCCVLSLFFILFCFNGVDFFSSYLVWLLVIAYNSIIFFKLKNFESNLILVKDNENIKGTLLFEEELNHENIKIRKYYRSKKNCFQYVAVYLCLLLFPLLIFSVIPFKYPFNKINEIVDNLFFNNFIIKFIFWIKSKKIINIKEVIEKNKKYTVKTYLDGKTVYKYKNKIHREEDAASFYPAEYFHFLKYRRKYFIHGKQVSENQFEIAKIQHNFKEF